MTQAGLAGTPETDIVSVFCGRCVAAGIPLGRAHVFIDTLQPVYEGRLFRWGYSPSEFLCTNTVALARKVSTCPLPYLWMYKRPRSGGAVPSLALAIKSVSLARMTQR